MTDKELLQLFEKPEDEKEYLEFMFGKGKKQIMEKVIQTEQFKEFFPKMITEDDEHWGYFGKNDVEKTLGSHMSWLGYLSNIEFEVTREGEDFPTYAKPFNFLSQKYWLMTMFGQGSMSWILPDEDFQKEYGDCISEELKKKLSETQVDVPKFKPKAFEMGVLNLNPNLNEITGVVDTETDGKKFAIGTKNNYKGFVLNFGDRSCLLFMGDIQPIDLRKFNFDEFTSIEINGNKFVKEHQHDN